MRKIHLLGLALFAVLVFSAFATAAAFAESEWLVDGAAVTTPLAVESSGTLTLTDTTNGVSVACTGIGKGTIGAGAADEVTEILSTTGTEPVPCTLVAAGSVKCEEPTSALALNLPWVTEIHLVEGKFMDLVGPHAGGGDPGWKTECLIAKIFKIAQECSSHDALTEILILETDVDIDFLKAEKAVCTNGDEAFVEGETLIVIAGKTVSVS